MKNLRKNLKKNQKGFTLVEIIVVLVILAILAAASIPTMLGFVEEAKGKSEIANARAAYVACQSIATEIEATGGTAFATTAYTIGTSTGTDVQGKLDKMLGKDMAGATVKATVTAGKVSPIVYTKGKYQVTITSGGSSEIVKLP